MVTRRVGGYTASLHDHLGSRATGHVHSIFRQSLNVDIDGLLLNVSANPHRLSALGIALDPDIFAQIIETVALNDVVRWSPGTFAVYPAQGIPVVIPWDRLECVDNRIPFAAAEASSLSLLHAALRQHELETRIGLVQDAPFHRAMATLRDPDRSAADIGEALEWLLGRGQGLTPAGDDVIAGFAFIAWLSGHKVIDDRLREEVVRRTTAVSATLLHVASNGYTSQVLVDLWRAMQRSSAEDIERALLALLDVGHTSGGDTAFGIGLGIDRFAQALAMERAHA